MSTEEILRRYQKLQHRKDAEEKARIAREVRVEGSRVAMKAYHVRERARRAQRQANLPKARKRASE